MVAFSDLFGKNSVIEQLLLWGLLNQVVSATSGPALTALQQDLAAKHPLVALDAQTAAEAAERGMWGEGQAAKEAALTGIDAQRFALLRDLHKQRIPPADLATAVLRHIIEQGEADAEAKPQGYTPQMMRVLTDLAADALGPEQLAEAARRKIIPEHGTGEGSVSYEQGIAEGRLHDKWGPVLLDLMHQLLSAPDAAAAVVRNFANRESMAKIAEQQGIDAETFAIMIDLAGDAPGPQQLAEALRRGAIEAAGRGAGSTSFEQGIAEGRLAEKWAPVIEALARVWPTPVDAIDATVKGQIPAAEGKDMYERLGGDPQFYPWLLDSAGDAPSPLELADMAARKIIKWRGRGPDVLSFDQGVAEGRLKDKWTSAVQQMTKYLPPPGEIGTFLAHTAITKERAIELLDQHYMDPDILAAFINEAELTALSDYRGLTQSAVVDMYYARMIDRDQAINILEALHVSPTAAPLLLSYADLRQVIDSVQKSVQRIAGLYTGRKIGLDTARNALVHLGIPNASVEEILMTWELQAQANVKILTEAQIVSAWYYKVIPESEAIELLGAIGYTPYDAWIVLSLKAKGPLPGKPPKVTAPPPGTVIPGVT